MNVISAQIAGNDLSKTEVLSELDEYNRQYYRPYVGRRKRSYRPWFGYGGWQDFNVIYNLFHFYICSNSNIFVERHLVNQRY